MARGKYYRRKKKKNILPWVLAVLCVALIGLLVALWLPKSGADSGETEQTGPSTQQTQETDPTTQPTQTTAPTETTAPTQPTETTEATEPTEETETTGATEPTETTEVTEATTPSDPGPSELGLKVAETAKGALGTVYAYGGSDLEGFDTTGLVFYCFRENGINAPRTFAEQLEFGEEVSADALQPGDVLFFWMEDPEDADYVGIYVGEDRFVAARNEKHPVTEMALDSEYFSERFVLARRYG